MPGSPSKRKEPAEAATSSDAKEPKEKKAKWLSAASQQWVGQSVQLMNLVIEEKREREIVVLKYDSKVKDALQVLQKENILGAPVTATGHALHSNEEDFFFGVCDVFSVLRALFTNKLIADAEPSKRWAQLKKVAEQLEDSKVMDVISGASSRYFAKPMTEASLREIIFNGFFKGDPSQPHPAQRLVLWENNKIQSLLTQSDVLRFLWNHKDHLGETVHKTVRQLQLEKKVDTVSEETLAIDAFYQMYQNDHSCVAVVDKSGKLVESLSQSDLRGLTTNDLIHLASENVVRFLSRRHQSLKEFKSWQRAPLAKVKPAQHLKTVIQSLVEHDVHRVYIVDTHEKPIGIVTLSDVLKLCVQ